MILYQRILVALAVLSFTFFAIAFGVEKIWAQTRSSSGFSSSFSGGPSGGGGGGR